jgi:hypothetical protein
MRYSYSFSWFRTALEKTVIDISELVRTQIELHPNGWTEERLLSLFLGQTRLEPRIYSSGGKCKLCKRYLERPDTEELSWKRKVERIKIGVDCNAPLSKEEQKELDDAITDFENRICRWCRRENRRKNLEFTQTSIWVYAPYAINIGHGQCDILSYSYSKLMS